MDDLNVFFTNDEGDLLVLTAKADQTIGEVLAEQGMLPSNQDAWTGITNGIATDLNRRIGDTAVNNRVELSLSLKVDGGK